MSGVYSTQASALSEAEALKKNAYPPFIEPYCIYFQGLTHDGPRFIVAAEMPKENTTQAELKMIIKNYSSRLHTLNKGLRLNKIISNI